MSKIPKIVHQTWMTDDASWIQEGKEEWLKINPDWEYRFYTDKDIDIFIKDNFDSHVYDCYSRIYNGQLRADFFRYCVLYISGGVYCDVDMRPAEPFSRFITDTDSCIFAKSPRFNNNDDFYNTSMFNAFLASEPKHPIFKDMIAGVCDNIVNNRFSESSQVHHLSGTDIVRGAITRVLQLASIPIGYIAPGIKVIRVWEQSYEEHLCQFLVLPDSLEPDLSDIPDPVPDPGGLRVLKAQLHFESKYSSDKPEHKHYGVFTGPLYKLT